MRRAKKLAVRWRLAPEEKPWPSREEPAKAVNIKIEDEELKGRYSNLLRITHTREEFILDFINLVPPQGMVTSRIVTSPGHMKRIIGALAANLRATRRATAPSRRRRSRRPALCIDDGRARGGRSDALRTNPCGPAMERAAALLVLALAVCGCGAPPSPAAETARAWGEGPAHWLLLPEEQAGLAAVHSSGEFATFLAGFWSCRNAGPPGGDNTFGRLFAERVAAADRLYEEPGVRGSLTARGGALVLLGPPRFLRYSQRKAPSLEGTTGSGARPTRLLKVEAWGYLPNDLPAALRSQLGLDETSQQELTVDFLVSGRHTRMLEGEELLEAAARAASHCATTEGS